MNTDTTLYALRKLHPFISEWITKDRLAFDAQMPDSENFKLIPIDGFSTKITNRTIRGSKWACTAEETNTQRKKSKSGAKTGSNLHTTIWVQVTRVSTPIPE